MDTSATANPVSAAITSDRRNFVTVRNDAGFDEYYILDEKTGKVVYWNEDYHSGFRLDFFYDRNNMGKALKLASDGHQVYILAENAQDKARQLLTVASCDWHGRPALARPIGFGRTTPTDSDQIQDLFVDGGKVMVGITNKDGHRTEVLQHGAGYFFD